MDAVPKLIFNELDEQAEESQRFLKFLEERLPEWLFQLLMKNGKIFYLGNQIFYFQHWIFQVIRLNLIMYQKS